MSFVNMALTMWPVGSIYISYSGTSPAEIFGGTWTQITGKFLRAANDVNTGGSDTHTLTVAEMPSHSHKAQKWNTSGTSSGYLAKTETANTPWSYSLDTNAVGGGGAHNNMPAYQNVYVWRRTA